MFVDNWQPAPGFDYQPGVVAEMARGFDPGTRRPYLDRNGRLAVSVRTGRWTVNRGQRVPIREHRLVRDMVHNGLMAPPMVTNATALRKEEWLQLDTTILKAARYRLQLVSDLMDKVPFGGFNGMSKVMLEYESMSDPGEATVDMDALTPSRGDRPRFQLEGLPLPITHSDFSMSMRLLSISRNGNTPLDTTLAEAGTRRVAEAVEKTAIGNQTGVTYGGNSTQVGGYGRTSSVYGLVNFSARLTKTNAYLPTGNGRAGTGWKASDLIADVLAAIDTFRANKFFGPFMVYTSTDWDQYLDADYILTGGNVATQTLRERLLRIKDITDVKRLDFLFASTIASTTGPGYENVAANYPFTMVLVQMTPDVIQMVNGMDVTTVQWETKGGMEINFKIMTIQVPRIRADFYGNCGVLHMTASL